MRPAAGRRAPAAYDQNQHDALMVQHAPLVRRLALRLAGRLPANVELDDLIQAGMMGLLDAVKRYREVATAQFETYATQRIRGAMLDELRRMDWMPRGVRERSRRLEEAVHAASQQLGRQPAESEIAAVLELSLDEYQALLHDAHGAQLLYLDDLGGDPDAFLAAEAATEPLQVSATDDPLAALLAKGLRDTLIIAIEQLPEREKLLLSLYYEQGLNLKEIGLVLEVTEARVSQLRSQAIARLRSHMARV
ncbi:MAG: RNA polymerase sigma factor FliA [Pigmentiphaga sp.]